MNKGFFKYSEITKDGQELSKKRLMEINSYLKSAIKFDQIIGVVTQRGLAIMGHLTDGRLIIMNEEQLENQGDEQSSLKDKQHQELKSALTKVLDKYFPDEMDSQMYHPNLDQAVDKILETVARYIEESKPLNLIEDSYSGQVYLKAIDQVVEILKGKDEED